MTDLTVTERAGLFREDMRQGLDAEYWTRALQGCSVHFVAKESGIFRVHPSGASMRNYREGAGLFDRLRTFELLLKTLPPGELRTLTEESLTAQIGLMAAKFRRRKKGGKRIGGAGAGSAIFFLARHPVLLLQSLRTLRRDPETRNSF